MCTAELRWWGWGTFRIRPPQGGPTVLFDPCISALLEDPFAPIDALDADLIVLTHGHHEHIRDVHRVLRRWPRPILAPQPVADFLVRAGRVPARWITALTPDERLDHEGLTVVPRAFDHVDKHAVSGKVQVLAEHGAWGAVRRLLPQVRAVVQAAWVIRGQPEHGPFLAWDLRWPGFRAFFGVEAFTDRLTDDRLDAFRDGSAPDLLVVGVESGHEKAAGRQTRRMGARAVVGAAVHAPFERFYGRSRASESDFLAASGGGTFWPGLAGLGPWRGRLWTGGA